MDIALVYLLLIGFGILVYVLLDGFSLGVGILSPLLNSPEDKGLAMKSLAHLWDSNQTWLVFGGVVLFVAFPSVYSYVLSNLYIPIILMLIALIFRGVALNSALTPIPARNGGTSALLSAPPLRPSARD